MKIIFHHHSYSLTDDYKYNDINYDDIILSELLYNDKFKYIKIYYDNLKFNIKTPIMNDYYIEKNNDCYIFKFHISYISFYINLEKYIVKKSITLLKNWYSDK